MKKSRKILSLLLTLAMVVSLFAGIGGVALAVPTAAWSTVASTAAADTDYSESSGDYTVNTALGLAYVATQGNLAGHTVTLTANIDISAYSWVPIAAFNGTFDGDGHYITGLYYGNTSGNDVGFVGTNNGTIQNVGFLDVYINSSRISGAIAATNNGTIDSVMVTGEVRGSGRGSGTSVRATGGIVGNNNGTISNSYTNATVYNAGHAGGIAGANTSAAARVTNCFVTGYASNAYDAAYKSGSLVGYRVGDGTTGVITNSYYLTNSVIDDWPQLGGVPAEYTPAADAYEFGADGKLKSDGTTTVLAGLNNAAFTASAGKPYPVLAWETGYYHTDIAPAEVLGLTVKSADGYFADFVIPFDDIRTVPPASVLSGFKNSSGVAYTYAAGLTIAELMDNYFPYGQFATSVNLGGYAGNIARAETRKFLVSAINGTADETKSAFILTADGGSGASRVTGITEAVVTLPYSNVTIVPTPSSATVQIKDSQDNLIAPTSGKTYKLVTGETYQYTVTAQGYASAIDTFDATGSTQDVPVTLSAPPPVTPPGATTYTVSGYTGANGTVTPSKTSAQAGETITLTVAPADSYAIAALAASGTVIGQAISGSTNTYTFTMPGSNVTISATFAKIVLTLYTQQGDSGPQVKAAVFTRAELTDLGTTYPAATAPAYLYYRNDAWQAVVATEVLTLDTLFNNAGVSANWKAGSYVNAYASGDGFFYNLSYEDFNARQYYTDPNATSVNLQPVPQGVATVWNSGQLTGSTVGAIAAGAYDSGKLRFVIGVSDETYTGESKAAGARLVTDVTKIVLVYEATYVPPGSKPDTHTPDEDKESGTDTGTETPVLPNGGVTIETPNGKPAVENSDGSVTLPGGGTITLPDTKVTVEAPDGTVVDKNGTVTVPKNETAKIETPGKIEITVTGGAKIDANGKITLPAGGDGAKITYPNGTTAEIPDDYIIEILDADTPLASGLYIFWNSPFTDVKYGDWFFGAVEFVATRGLMNGVGDGKFAPNAKLTRAMLVTILARYDGVDTDGGETWYTKAIEWGVKEGVTDGTNPNGDITREQLVTMLYRYAKLRGYDVSATTELDKFDDADKVSGWALEAVQWAVATGLIAGRTPTTLAPDGNATRAEVATILQRFLELVK
jgi:hypothetical protein